MLELVRMDRRVRDGNGPAAALVVRLADDESSGAEQAGDDAGQRADRPGAEHDHGCRQRQRAQPERVDARGNGLGEHRDVGVQPVVDHVDARRRHRDELAEAAGAAPADQLAMLANVFGSRAAVEAGSAGDLRVHRHSATGEGLRPRRGSGHLADQLVTHDQRRRTARASRRDALDVAAANADPLHADQDFARVRDGRLHVEDVERSLQRVDEGTHRPRLPAPLDEHLRVHLRRERELLRLEVLVGDMALGEACPARR